MVEKIGIAPLEVSASEAIGLVRQAEAGGFESAWTSGSHGYLRLAAFAQHTERITLGTAVVVQPLINPVAHADMLTDLGDLASGRAIAGIAGSGRSSTASTASSATRRSTPPPASASSSRCCAS